MFCVILIVSAIKIIYDYNSVDYNSVDYNKYPKIIFPKDLFLKKRYCKTLSMQQSSLNNISRTTARWSKI